jgi:hypothetical protein
VLSAITAIFIGLPVLSLASDFWFGQPAPHVHVYDHHGEDYDKPWWLDRRDRRGKTEAGTN